MLGVGLLLFAACGHGGGETFDDISAQEDDPTKDGLGSDKFGAEFSKNVTHGFFDADAGPSEDAGDPLALLSDGSTTWAGEVDAVVAQGPEEDAGTVVAQSPDPNLDPNLNTTPPAPGDVVLQTWTSKPLFLLDDACENGRANPVNASWKVYQTLATSKFYALLYLTGTSVDGRAPFPVAPARIPLVQLPDGTFREDTWTNGMIVKAQPIVSSIYNPICTENCELQIPFTTTCPDGTPVEGTLFQW